MKYLIINADDFGYSEGINRGIIEAHTQGVVTSTSIMVDGIAAHEAPVLKGYEKMSVGLHFVLPDPNSKESGESEFQRQLEKFKALMGRNPDHIDVHKPRPKTYPPVKGLLEKFSESHKIPVRNLGHANAIRSFFGLDIKSGSIDEAKVSLEGFKQAIGEVKDGFNELMCHAGYSDEYLRSHSSYSDIREAELKTLKSQEAKSYLESKNVTLCDWRHVKL